MSDLESKEAWITAIAPAKINPYLEILGKRDDGYHELATCMVTLTLCDRLRVRANDTGRITFHMTGDEASEDVPRDERNLVVKVARELLTRHANERADTRGLEIELEKNVPSQSGMGGASSDAAACLAAASKALRLAISERESDILLASLGSDCVFFARSELTGVALCEGRGEQVTPLPALDPPWHVVLIVPDVRVPTPEVYRALGFPLSARKSRHSFHSSLLHDSSGVEARLWLKNDLEHPALRSFPELAAWRTRLDECGSSHFRLTGTGATFYGLFDDRDAALASLREIEDIARTTGPALRSGFVVQCAGHGAAVVETS